jgi:DNA primase
LRRLFEGDQRGRLRQKPGRSANREWRSANRGEWVGRRSPLAPRYPLFAGRALSSDPYVVASPHLAASPVHRGHRAAIPRREALMLQAVINHPWLLHEHLEELAAIEFRHVDAARVKGELLDIFVHGVAMDAETMAAELARRDLAPLVTRLQNAITTPSVWGAKPQAAPDDVLMTWKQLVALHRQWHSLTRELRDAEQALGQETTEANYSWLQDVKVRLSLLDGTEALIEGFGDSSGRSARSL